MRSRSEARAEQAASTVLVTSLPSGRTRRRPVMLSAGFSVGGRGGGDCLGLIVARIVDLRYGGPRELATDGHGPSIAELWPARR